MKTIYERMSKVQKKKVIRGFKEDKKELYNKTQRMIILSYIGILYGFILFFYDLFIKKSTLNYILDIIVFVFCLVALFIVNNIKKDVINKYVLENKKDFKN